MDKVSQTDEMGSTSILICDRQPLFRLGLKKALEQGGFRVVGEASDIGELMDALAGSVPEILLLDIFVVYPDNFSFLRQIKAQYPTVKIVLTIPKNLHPIELVTAIQAGIAGLILRDSPMYLLVRALRSVTSGVPWINRELMEQVLQGFDSLPVSEEVMRKLTDRERQILVLLAKGLSNKEIAQQLRLSLQTVKTYVSQILQKLNARNRREAARYALILVRSGFKRSAKGFV